MKLFILFSFLIVNWVASAQKVFDSAINRGRDIAANIDSLKWNIYVLTYDVKIRKYVDGLIEDSLFVPVECDVQIYNKEVEGDTEKYFFIFYRFNQIDKYLQKKADFFIGVGFVKSMKIYYPIPGETKLANKLDFYPGFFKRRENEFIAYLKEYNGYVNPWLKQEAILRKVLRLGSCLTNQ